VEDNGCDRMKNYCEAKKMYEEFKRLRKLMGKPVRDIFGRAIE
jgi:hypothetical protein